MPEDLNQELLRRQIKALEDDNKARQREKRNTAAKNVGRTGMAFGKGVLNLVVPKMKPVSKKNAQDMLSGRRELEMMLGKPKRRMSSMDIFKPNLSKQNHGQGGKHSQFFER